MTTGDNRIRVRAGKTQRVDAYTSPFRYLADLQSTVHHSLFKDEYRL
jgi:hypothetical protein